MFGRKSFLSAVAGLLLAGYCADYARSAEFEAVDRLTADGYTLLKTTADVLGSGFSVGGSTFAVQYGKVGIGTSTPSALLHISSAAGVSGNLVLISTGPVNVIRMTGAGEIFAIKLIGDGSGIPNIPWASVNKAGSSLADLITRSAGDLTTGTLLPARGGTGADLSGAGAGAIPWFTGSGVMGNVGAGTAGYFLKSNGVGAPTWASSSGVVVSSAANLTGGAPGAHPYQSAANTTAMLLAGTAGWILQGNAAAAPTWTNTPTLTGTNITNIPWLSVIKTGSSLADLITRSAGDLTTGTLALARGGTGADMSGTGGASFIVKQSGAGAAFTSAMLTDAEVPDTITINGTNNVTWASVNKAGSSLVDLITRSAGDLTTGLLLPARGGTGADLSGAGAGGVPWFSAAGGVMGNVGAGAAGYFLKSNGAGAPTWASPTAVIVSSAANLTGGAPGAIPYQSALNTTAMLLAGTAGWILQGNAAGAPTWTNTPTLVGTNIGIVPSATNANTVDGYHATAYNDFAANAIVTRNASGNIYSNYFNMTADLQTTQPQYLVGEWSLNSLSYVTPANVTAGDSDKLGGLPASSYLTLEYSYRGCVGTGAACAPPACVGTSVSVSCPQSTAGTTWYCERTCTRP